MWEDVLRQKSLQELIDYIEKAIILLGKKHFRIHSYLPGLSVVNF